MNTIFGMGIGISYWRFGVFPVTLRNVRYAGVSRCGVTYRLK